LEFYFARKGHILRGLKGPKIKVIGEKQLPKAMKDGSQLCMLLLISSQAEDVTEIRGWQCFSMETEVTKPTVTALLQQYDDLFQERKGPST